MLEFMLIIKKVNFILEIDVYMIDSLKYLMYKVDIISWKGGYNFVWLKIIIYVSLFYYM